MYQGRQRARVPPPPLGARHTKGYPQANFFIFPSKFFLFFLPTPITSPIYPFFLSLRGFLFLRVYFPIRVSFRVSEGKKRVNMNCFSYPTCVCLVIIHSILVLHSHSLLFCSLCYVLALSFVVDAVFFADLPILLPSVGLSLLLCVIIRLGVFRGSEAKKWGFVLWLGGIYTEKGRTRHLCAPSALCLWLFMPVVSFPVQE